MTTTAIAVLQTPWDCKWSQFGQMHRTAATAPAEGLWVCAYEGTPRAITTAECESCSHWENAPPQEAVAACPHSSTVARRLEVGVRLAAFALAVMFAATGFIVLTRPLAIPFTISMWMGALASFLLGVWGRFDRQALPPESW